MTKELEQAAQIAKCIYERAFDARWQETDGAERELWIQVGKEVAKEMLTQLRQRDADLERRGYAGHKKGCAYIFLTCNCGWDEMKRELEEK